MFSIFLGVLSAAFDSTSLSFRKKALDTGTLSKTMFKYFAFVFGFFIILFLNYTFGLEFSILNDYKYLLIVLIIVIFGTLNTFLHLHILKTVKLSEILPYDNLDKLFIVLIGTILYYGTDQQPSIVTLGTTVLTIILIIALSVDFKNIKIPKSVGLFTLFKLIKALLIVATGFILLKYTNFTFIALNWIYELIVFTIIAFVLKDSFKSMLKQSKVFYISRFSATLLGRSAYIIGLYIIQTSGLIVATLLGFLGIVFNIISMKLILKDNPEKKQIILAFMVLILIGIGYYFK